MIPRAGLLAALLLFALGLLAQTASASPAALELPAPVAAKLRGLLPREQPAHPAAQRGFESRFELDAAHGYRIAVLGRGETVQVEVGRPEALLTDASSFSHFNSQALTVYAARGTVTPRRIAATFGKLGRIDVRFRPAGKPVALSPHRHCKGLDHYTAQRGDFVGTISFDGEDDYVAVHSHRAHGRVRSPLRLNCFPGRFRAAASGVRQRPVRGSQHSSPGRSLAAGWRHAVDSTELYAFGGRRRLITLAIVEESLGHLAKFHSGFAITRPKIFSVDDALTHATLTPPAPFHGKGVYSAAPDGTRSWTGSLSISFPGAPRWPLTGDQFEVHLGAGL